MDTFTRTILVFYGVEEILNEVIKIIEWSKTTLD
jgi:hypothetical protein